MSDSTTKTKKCTECGKLKTPNKFYVNRGKRRGDCILCHKGYKNYFKRKRNYCKNKKILFNLEVEDIKKIFESKRCYYCNIELSKYVKLKKIILKSEFKKFFLVNSVTNKLMDRFTIDRLFPNKGYVKGNIVPACWICNRIKGKYIPAKEYKKIAKKVRWSMKRDIDQKLRHTSHTRRFPETVCITYTHTHTHNTLQERERERERGEHEREKKCQFGQRGYRRHRGKNEGRWFQLQPVG